jgi:hypothetical protein
MYFGDGSSCNSDMSFSIWVHCRTSNKNILGYTVGGLFSLQYLFSVNILAVFISGLGTNTINFETLTKIILFI